MRGLAAFDPKDWPKPAAASTRSELWSIGYGRHRDGKIVRTVDAGEGVAGVKLKRHPIAMLRDTPDLWALCNELMDGAFARDLTREDRRRLSHAEVELIHLYRAGVERRNVASFRASVAAAAKGTADGNAE